ncbi:MAG: alpha/beta hydrolase [SAR324 cluster bacterium]|nr:alpha/beta hydrolase [SAR324 cluster bacterium]
MNEITLSAGDLKFSALVEGTGQTILFLHGFPDTKQTFSKQIEFFSGRGYRAVAPMLRGYEPSSQTKAPYYLRSVAGDVLQWIDELGEDKVHLVGHDWGAVISYVVCAMAPEKFMSLSTLAIPHPRRFYKSLSLLPVQLRKSWYMLFFQMRVIADMKVEANDWALIEKLWRDWSPDWKCPESMMHSIKNTFSKPGVKAAALGYYRALFEVFSSESRRSWKLLGAPLHVPTLALTGERDGCMDSRLYDMMRSDDFSQGLQITRVPNAGHFLHLEQPAQVNQLLFQFINNHS